jgi:hypothetical protein
MTDQRSRIVITSSSPAYMGLLTDLLQWHQADPSDAAERARNEVIFSFQGNRNPLLIVQNGPPQRYLLQLNQAAASCSNLDLMLKKCRGNSAFFMHMLKTRLAQYDSNFEVLRLSSTKNVCVASSAGKNVSIWMFCAVSSSGLPRHVTADTNAKAVLPIQYCSVINEQ